MKTVRPYDSLQQAMDALDNGGRFYHWSSHAGDSIVTAAELRKGASVLLRDQYAAQHFAVATSALSEKDRERLTRSLADDARQVLETSAPRPIDPKDFSQSVEQRASYLVEGEVHPIEDDDRLGYVPVTTLINNVPMTTSMPTGRLYRVYEVGEGTGCEVLVPKAIEPISGRMLFVGIPKSCSHDKTSTRPTDDGRFWRLEATYAAEG